MEENRASTRETRQSTKRERRNSQYSIIETPKKDKPKRRKSDIASKVTPKNLNEAFLEEEPQTSHNISLTPYPKEPKRRRRLSGWYTRDLNTGFIEEVTQGIEEDAEEDDEFFGFVAENTVVKNNENILDNSNLSILKNIENTTDKLSAITMEKYSPIKNKLRKKQSKEWTYEQIVAYYTDRTPKKKNNLETVFETPKPEVMGKKKMKRYINFNERNSAVQTRKRKTKASKLGVSFDRVDMSYFFKKMQEIEQDL